MARARRESYSWPATLRCERALVTLLGDIGPWSERIVLVGGLVPRYLIGSLPLGAAPHVGSTDVDLVIELAVDEAAETYETLQANLKKSGFVLSEPSYRWFRRVDGTTVVVEFLCATDQVGAGRIYRPRQGTGSNFAAFNVPGADLTTRDFVEATVEAERLDHGGLSQVKFRVAGLLPYVTLKILAFQDRHHNKDAYDLVYTLLNYPEGGPSAAGRTAAVSRVRQERQTVDALGMLAERFLSPGHDGPSAYADFLAEPDDADSNARLRNEAVAAVSRFLAAARTE
ncbi:MAG: hypothetical protein F4236_05095 [Acidimicrobiia bacterium]|nr:hypothetical protein [Acidimicrobiia bacterium]MYE67536.1 hypothetical protein [Acidimicrobiia bacterium]MYJ12900.1 hypothetical protein [Acidimicrobiia bacterium]